MCHHRGVRILVWLASAALAATLAHGQDLLRLRNGDRLSGRLVEATGRGLRWQSPAASAPIELATTNLFEVRLAPRPPSRSRQLHSCVAELTNGDRLTGELIQWTPEVLTWESWYAGRLSLMPAMVRGIEWRASLPDCLYAGPTGLADWQVSGHGKGWQYRQGWLHSPMGLHGVISRAMDWPDVACLDFEVAWRGQPQWQVGFGYQQAGNLSSSGYNLNFSGNIVYLNRTGPSGTRSIGQGQTAAMRSPARVSIRIHRPQKSIALLLNDTLVRQWTDPGEFAGTGRYLIFVAQGSCDLRVGNIRLRRWDGRLEADEPWRSPTEDVLVLSNADRLSGEVRAIAGGEVLLVTGFGEMKVPVSRLVSLQFAGNCRATARRQDGEVRGFLPDGTRLTVGLERLDEKALRGTSENFGAVNVPLDALTRVQFQLHQPPPAAEDDWEAVQPTAE